MASALSFHSFVIGLSGRVSAAALFVFRVRLRARVGGLGALPGVSDARRRRPRRGRGLPPAVSRRPAPSRVQAARRWRASLAGPAPRA